MCDAGGDRLMLVERARRTEKITKSAVLLSLALIFQIGFTPFAQPVVGPLVNMVLLLAVITVGPAIACFIGCLTPMAAYGLGIMPVLPVVPVIILGNLLYVLTFYYLKKISLLVGVAGAAVTKTALMALAVRLLAKYLIPSLPLQIITVLTLPQLYSALLGGGMALLVDKYLPQKVIQD